MVFKKKVVEEAQQQEQTVSEPQEINWDNYPSQAVGFEQRGNMFYITIVRYNKDNNEFKIKEEIEYAKRDLATTRLKLLVGKML